MLFRIAIFVALVAASVDGTCPTVPSGGCAVCGVGKCVSNPDVILTIPGRSGTCAELEDEGIKKNQTVVDNCAIIAPYIATPCGCNTVGYSTAVPTRKPTRRPTRKPTRKPTKKVPTRKPSLRRPTSKPIA